VHVNCLGFAPGWACRLTLARRALHHWMRLRGSRKYRPREV